MSQELEFLADEEGSEMQLRGIYGVLLFSLAK
jgi:hypothetical protein